MNPVTPDPNAWTHEIEVSAIPPQGLDLELKPDAAVLAQLAKITDVIAVNDLAARLDVRVAADGSVEVQGTLKGSVRQACVVSLLEFDNPVEETIEARFSETAPADAEDDEGEDDGSDPIVNGKIDLGALGTEFLSLAIDPYPRMPGAVFQPAPEDTPAESPAAGPFDQLSKLTKNPNKSG